MVKTLPAMQEIACRRPWVWSLGGEVPLEKEIVNHSSIRAWQIPRTGEPDGLLSMEPQESDMT